MILEVSKSGRTRRESILRGSVTAWTPERIKNAFSYGRGTEADLLEYIKNNKSYCYFIDTESAAFEKLTTPEKRILNIYTI